MTNADKILNELNNAGFEAFKTGGFVRDSILGRPSHDVDITTSATPEEVANVFPNNADFVGKSFGVSLVKMGDESFEIASFRNDSASGNGRKPDSVELTLDVREDVKRRDFTCNALLMNLNGNIVDHVGGMEDINNKLVRAIGNPDNRFNEDHLRLARAVRFATTLDFTIETETFEAIKNNAHNIQNISAERINAELCKILTSGNAAKGFELLKDSGLLKFILPEMLDFVGNNHDNPKYHPEGDVWNHEMLLLKNLPKDCSITLALGVLLHDIGKPATRKVVDGKTIFHGHDRVGAPMAKNILTRMKFSNDVIDTVVALVSDHMRLFGVKDMKKSTLIKLVRLPHFNELLALHRLDCGASNNDFSQAEFIENFVKTHENEINFVKLLNGNDLKNLGFVAGPSFKVILETVENEQLNGNIHNFDDAVAFVLKNF